MKKGIVAGIDCGTSAIKAALFDTDGNTVSIVTRACPCAYHRDGRIEQDPDRIVTLAMSCLKHAVHAARVDPSRVKAVSVASQRASVVCVDRSGRAISNAISWQDLRGAGEIEELRKKIDDRSYYRITGLPNNPVFSLGKILWLRKNTPSLYGRSDKFVLVGDYLLRKLGADAFFTDVCGASATGMLDISRLDWSADILKVSGVSRDKLAPLTVSGSIAGYISAEASGRCGLAKGTPIVAGGGDQQCAGIGAGCVETGTVSYTLGTAGMLLAYSDQVIRDPEMRVACCVHAVPGAWDVEGLQNSGASCLSWFAQIVTGRGKFDDAFLKRVERVSAGSDGVLFYPYLAGAAAPRWNPSARGAFMGLAFGQSRETLARSVMEGVSFQGKEILDIFDSLGLSTRRIHLTGGGSEIGTWKQLLADIFGKSVCTLRNPQATVLGAGILAAVGAGLFGSVPDAARRLAKAKEAFVPDRRKAAVYREAFRRFSAAHATLGKEKAFDPAVAPGGNS